MFCVLFALFRFVSCLCSVSWLYSPVTWSDTQCFGGLYKLSINEKHNKTNIGLCCGFSTDYFSRCTIYVLFFFLTKIMSLFQVQIYKNSQIHWSKLASAFSHSPLLIFYFWFVLHEWQSLRTDSEKDPHGSRTELHTKALVIYIFIVISLLFGC